MDNPVQARTTETFADMVKRLFKPMADDAASNIHAIVGITGELCGEIIPAVIRHDSTNLLEELGDVRFYMQALMNRFGWDALTMRGKVVDSTGWSNLDTMLVAAGDVQDLLKKVWVYNKPVEDVQEKLYEHFTKLFKAYISFASENCLTDGAICDANQYKLSTGPNARYPLGYSDQAAIARADKAAEETSNQVATTAA